MLFKSELAEHWEHLQKGSPALREYPKAFATLKEDEHKNFIDFTVSSDPFPDEASCRVPMLMAKTRAQKLAALIATSDTLAAHILKTKGALH